MAHVTLILGGARSGKSARALILAANPPHIFIATAEALDDEMADRIRLHQAERGADWGLAEAPLDLAKAIRANAAEGATLLIDCLTLWLSNLMHHEREVQIETEALLAALAQAPGRVVLVSNEIGMGLSPMNALGREFRDAQGRLNQQVATAADRVEFVAAGLPLVLKGGA
ncbi:MAG: bifunctional adenosylcobinamide kinase/adenosylcobinamide-phosphate guanylyltransferase [Paracoccaceae bacterium]|nr:bifunctional adenosylcobinamide kinase/adenosylcobinamide-phosphate guanylyltransferase [Paracoccaceae bacterium]